MNREEAIKKALSARPKMKVESVKEMEKCYVINMVPESYKKDSGIYIGGGIRVDKKTGETRLYNPMIENLR